MLHLRALGPLDLRAPEGTSLQSVLSQPRRAALLVYLAAARPQGPHRRDTLLSLFWAEREEHAARHALSQALYALRRSLGRDVVETEGNEVVRLRPGTLVCDAVAFEEAIDEERWSAALALYRSDFLSGFHVADAPAFERWADRERERLRFRAAEAAWALAEERLRVGEPAEAERAAHRALRLAPTDESRARRFIEAMAAAGHRAAALRFYEKLARLLEEELEVSPSPETVNLMASVRSGDGLTTGAVPGETDQVRSRALPHSTRSAAVPEGATEEVPEQAPAAAPAVQAPNAEPVAALSGPDETTRFGLGWLAPVPVVLVLGIVVAFAISGRSIPTIESRVAVLSFENRTGDPGLDDLGAVAADWITHGLTAVESVQVLPPTAVREVLAGAGESDPIRRLAREKQVGLAVTGSFVLVGDSVEVRAQLADAAEGEVLAAFEPARSHRSNATGALAPIRDQVMGAVAMHLNDRLLAPPVEPPPPNYRAYRYYLTGIELFMSGRYPEAIEAFERARAADSTFWSPLFRMAVAYGNDGQFAPGDSVLRLLEAHRSELSQLGRIMVDWRRAVHDGDLASAYGYAREWYDRAPASAPRYVSASYALRVNRPGEAVSLFESEPKGSQLRRTWIDYYADFTGSLHVLGEHGRELEVAREARDHFPGHPAAFLFEARALAALHRPEESEARAEALLALASEVTATSGLLVRIGDALAAHGHDDAARRVYGHGLQWWREHGSPGNPAERVSYADLLRRMGRLEEAAAAARQAHAAAPDDHHAHALIGLIAARRGDREVAERIEVELHDLDDPYRRSALTYYRARIRAQLGDRVRAAELLRQAHSEGLWLGHGVRVHHDLQSLHGYRPFDELMRPKG